MLGTFYLKRNSAKLIEKRTIRSLLKQQQIELQYMWMSLVGFWVLFTAANLVWNFFSIFQHLPRVCYSVFVPVPWFALLRHFLSLIQGWVVCCFGVFFLLAES